jgi:muramidase (phage lysozyme)
MKTTAYGVKNGDNLSKIARKFNTTPENIAKDNNIDDINLITEGQNLNITHQDECDLYIVFCDKAGIPIKITCLIQSKKGTFFQETDRTGTVDFNAIGDLNEKIELSIKNHVGELYKIGEITLDAYKTRILAKSRAYQNTGTIRKHKDSPGKSNIGAPPSKDNKKQTNNDIQKKTYIEKSEERNDAREPVTKTEIQHIEEARVRAFLKMIRVGEGTSDKNGYKRLVGGGNFDSFADHPLHTPRTIHMKGTAIRSTAAGAYQILYRTWIQTKKQLGLTDFSPASQDKAAIQLIKNRRNALEDVKKWKIREAILKCNREWASLPESPYGQPTRTMAQALNTYSYYYTKEIGK